MLKKHQELELLPLVLIIGVLAILIIGCNDNGGSPTGPQAVTITVPRNGATVPGELRVEGTYTEDVTKDIWVLIWPEQAPGIGWPQSDDAESGAPTLKENGKWSVTCYFGGPSQSYEIIVYTATPSASQIIGDTLKEWARNNSYPGLFSLPAGLTEKHRIQVRTL